MLYFHTSSLYTSNVFEFKMFKKPNDMGSNLTCKSCIFSPMKSCYLNDSQLHFEFPWLSFILKRPQFLIDSVVEGAIKNYEHLSINVKLVIYWHAINVSTCCRKSPSQESLVKPQQQRTQQCRQCTSLTFCRKLVKF